MLLETLSPRFSETDALGHINNTVPPVWFEQCRQPIFQFFTPSLDPSKWQLILAGYRLDFLSQLHYGFDVEIRTYIKRIGKSSFDVGQEVWQQDKLCVKGITSMVRFDYQNQISTPIDGEIRDSLTSLLVKDE